MTRSKYKSNTVVCFSAYMRFKGYDCNYNDDYYWALYEHLARTNKGMFKLDFGKYIMASGEAFSRILMKNCKFKISQWALFELSVGVEIGEGWFSFDVFSKSVHAVAK